MFGYNDKFSLNAINAINKKGELIDFNLSFPIESDFALPNDILQISIFEMRQDIGYQGFTSFKIFLGNYSSINDMYEDGSLKKAVMKAGIHVKSLDDGICYYDNESGEHVIYTSVDAGDIVVRDIDEFKRVLINISDEFKNIKSSVLRVRKMGI